MKALSLTLVGALLVLPALGRADDPPATDKRPAAEPKADAPASKDTSAERLRAQRQRTIDKRAERRAAGKAVIAKRNAAFNHAQTNRNAVQDRADAAMNASQSAINRQFNDAMTAGMIEAYRTNPYLAGRGGFFGGGLNTTAGLGVVQPPAPVYLNVPNSNGAQVGVISTGQGVSFVPPPHQGPTSPSGINR